MSLRLRNDAPAWARDLVNQLNQVFVRIANPLSPTRLVRYGAVTDLPPPSQWEDCIVRVADVGSGVQGLAYSDGTNWRRVDTNATL